MVSVMAGTSETRRPGAAAPASAAAQVVLPPTVGGLQGGQTVPTPAYDAALAALAAGDLSGGLEIAAREYRGGIRAGAQRWIDSIAAAMAGRRGIGAGVVEQHPASGLRGDLGDAPAHEAGADHGNGLHAHAGPPPSTARRRTGPG